MIVILISGKAQHGKDTSADIFKKCFEEKGLRVQVSHYADLLKYMCKAYYGWNGIKDEYGRSLLQHVGTDVIRAEDPDFWTDHMVRTATAFQNEWDVLLIPDCRLPNEVKCFTESQFETLHVRVVRSNFESPLTEEQQNHVTETALDNYPGALILNNDSDVTALENKIREIVNLMEFPGAKEDKWVRFGDETYIAIPEEPIDARADDCFDDLEDKAWEYVVSCLDYFGIEAQKDNNGNIPVSYDIAKEVFMVVLDHLRHSGVEFVIE